MIYQWYETKISNKVVKIHNAYSFNQEKRMKWLQKLCIWTLQKLRCNHFYDDQVVKRYALETDDLMKVVRSQALELRKQGYEGQLEIFMGEEDYTELIINPEMHRYVTVDLSRNVPRQVLGLTLYLMPHVKRGMFVVPSRQDKEAYS